MLYTLSTLSTYCIQIMNKYLPHSQLREPFDSSTLVNFHFFKIYSIYHNGYNCIMIDTIMPIIEKLEKIDTYGSGELNDDDILLIEEYLINLSEIFFNDIEIEFRFKDDIISRNIYRNGVLHSLVKPSVSINISDKIKHYEYYIKGVRYLYEDWNSHPLMRGYKVNKIITKMKE